MSADETLELADPWMAPISDALPNVATLVGEEAPGALIGERALVLPERPLWPDLQRRARREVTRETLAVLRRLPELVTRRFGDGTAFADERTRRRVLTRVLP